VEGGERKTETKLKTTLAITLTFLIAFSCGVALNPALNFLTHREPRLKANVYILAETMYGDFEIPTGNLITNIGERYCRNILGFDNETANNATKWISLSNVATPLVTWTVLTTEVAANGFTRALGTVTSWNNGTDYAFNVTKKFTATGSQQLQTAGLNWCDTSASDNNLFAAAGFTQTTFATNDNCTIKWVITFDAN
jgi:hypothetical protein